MMVFSNHPVDMLTMSSNRSWEQTSCMRISGSNHEYVYDDIKHGSVVCFQTTMDDFNINKANARILFKPYIDVEDEETHILFGGKVYGDNIDEFDDKAQEVANTIFNNMKEGEFELHCSLYNDNQPISITKKGDEILGGGITLINFDIYYTMDDASIQLFDKLKNEFYESDNVDPNSDIETLAVVFNDIYNQYDGGDECIMIIDDYLTILDEYYTGDEFESKMFPILDEYFVDFENLFSRKYQPKLYSYYMLCLKKLGDSFMLSHIDKYEKYVFTEDRFKTINDIHKRKLTDENDEFFLENYKKLKSIDESEFYKMKKINDEVNRGIIFTPYFEIKLESYSISSNRIIYICDIKNLKSGKISKSKIDSDNLIQYIFGHGTIVEKLK